MARAITRPRRAATTTKATASATTSLPAAALFLVVAAAALALALALVATPTDASGLPARVIPLTDASFEHDTQASTGQTTGQWAVLLTDSSATKTLPAARTAAKALAALAAQRSAEDAEENDGAHDPGCLYASVDASDEVNPALAARFRAFLPGPVLLLFRDRQLFPLPLPRVALSQRSVERAAAGASRSDGEAVDAAYHAILDFLTGGFREVDSERIPPPGYGGGGGASGGGAGGATAGGAAGLVSGFVDGAVNLLAAQKLELDGNHLMVVGVVTLALGLVAFVAFMGVAVAVTKGAISFGNKEPPPAGSDPAAVPARSAAAAAAAARKGGAKKPAPVPEEKEKEAEEVMGEGEEEAEEAVEAEAVEAVEEEAEAAAAEEEEEEEPKEEEATTMRRRRPGRA